MIFIVPESLSKDARAKAQELYETDMSLHPRTIVGSLWRLMAFVRPLGVFVPRRLSAGQGWRSRDWNLTLLGAAAAAVAINMVSNFGVSHSNAKTFIGIISFQVSIRY